MANLRKKLEKKQEECLEQRSMYQIANTDRLKAVAEREEAEDKVKMMTTQLEAEMAKGVQMQPRVLNAERNLSFAQQETKDANEALETLQIDFAKLQKQAAAATLEASALRQSLESLRTSQHELPSQIARLQAQTAAAQVTADKALQEKAKVEIAAKLQLQNAEEEILAIQASVEKSKVAEREASRKDRAAQRETLEKMARMQEELYEARSAVKQVSRMKIELQTLTALKVKEAEEESASILERAAVENMIAELKELKELRSELVAGDQETALLARVAGLEAKLEVADAEVRNAQALARLASIPLPAASVEQTETRDDDDDEVGRPSQSEVMELQSEVTSIKAQLKEAQALHESSEEAVKQSKQAKKESQAEIMRLSQDLATMQVDLASAKMSHRNAAAEIATLQQKLSAAGEEQLAHSRQATITYAKLAQQDEMCQGKDKLMSSLKDKIESLQSDANKQAGIGDALRAELQASIQANADKDSAMRMLESKLQTALQNESEFEAAAMAVARLESTLSDRVQDVNALKQKLVVSDMERKGAQKDVPRFKTEIESLTRNIELARQERNAATSNEDLYKKEATQVCFPLCPCSFDS